MSLIYWLSVCFSYFYFFISFLRLVFYVVSVSIVVLDIYCFFFRVVSLDVRSYTWAWSYFMVLLHSKSYYFCLDYLSSVDLSCSVVEISD